MRAFGTFTPDLHALVNWLVQCKIDTVAMESTGIYWIPIYELLEARGITPYLVNAHHVKIVPGRKTDVLDCQWLQKLHRGKSCAPIRSAHGQAASACAKNLALHKPILQRCQSV